MALQRLNARLVLIIPDLDQTIVGAADEIRLVAAVVVVDAIDALLVAVQREVGRVRAKLPNLKKKKKNVKDVCASLK